MKYLLISTPDLRASSFSSAILPQFDQIISSKLNQLDRIGVSEEELEVQQFHQRILSDKQKDWYQPILNIAKSLDNKEYKQSLDSVLSKLGEKKWLVDDPLLAHFLPLWLTKLEQPKVIFHYSEPMACAIELQRCWRFPINFSLALWESYVLAACKNVEKVDAVLVSQTKLLNEGDAYLKSISAKLGLAELVMPDTLETQAVGQSGYMSQFQLDIFDKLENNEISSLAKLTLSDQAKDVLSYYGQLRSGYEKIKTERDQLKSELASMASSAKLDREDDTKETTTIDETLCKVKVHVEGMEVLEFYSDPASPVLEMLRGHLVNDNQDQLIYLNCGEDDSDTIYFMSSNLLAMETEPIQSH